jgi:hypothetical protein
VLRVQPDKRDVADFSAPLVLVEVQLIEGTQAGYEELVMTVKHWLGIDEDPVPATPIPFPEDLKLAMLASEPSLASQEESSVSTSC